MDSISTVKPPLTAIDDARHHFVGNVGGFQPLQFGTLGLRRFGFTEAVFHGLQCNLHFVANIQGAFTVGIGKLVQGYHARSKPA